MSREIKFRFLPIWGDRTNFHYSDRYCEKDGYEMCGQYTGFKDKNGKEIYEGDIIKGAFNYLGNRQKHLTLHKVEYDYLGFDPFVNNDPEYSNDSVECTEVVGNIYENKELLNETN